MHFTRVKTGGGSNSRRNSDGQSDTWRKKEFNLVGQRPNVDFIQGDGGEQHQLKV